MMCTISKERIAFCAQLEGTRGVSFAVSPIALQSWYQCVPNEPIPTYRHSWPSTPECSLKIGDRQSEKKQWNSDERTICNATCGIDAGRGVSRHRGVSDGSDGACPLWRSHSARTELFFADVLVMVMMTEMGTMMKITQNRYQVYHYQAHHIKHVHRDQLHKARKDRHCQNVEYEDRQILSAYNVRFLTNLRENLTKTVTSAQLSDKPCSAINHRNSTIHGKL